jgi:hypothetical protein
VLASDNDKLRLRSASPQAECVNPLCDKLSASITHAERNSWVSPYISYVEVCANLLHVPAGARQRSFVDAKPSRRWRIRAGPLTSACGTFGKCKTTIPKSGSAS